MAAVSRTINGQAAHVRTCASTRCPAVQQLPTARQPVQLRVPLPHAHRLVHYHAQPARTRVGSPSDAFLSNSNYRRNYQQLTCAAPWRCGLRRFSFQILRETTASSPVQFLGAAAGDVRGDARHLAQHGHHHDCGRMGHRREEQCLPVRFSPRRCGPPRGLSAYCSIQAATQHCGSSPGRSAL